MSGDRGCAPAVARVVALFEALAPADLQRLGDFYAGDARFRDPFHDVTGLAAIERVFRHMFEALDAPSFVVREVLIDGHRAFIAWDFRFRLRSGRAASISGGSLLTFAPDGRIALHVDHWDACELFALLPGLGALFRWLKKRAAGGQLPR